MAVIQTIRNRFAKLAGFTIAIALIGFILMDAASGRFGDMLGKNNTAAKVNGTSIEAKDYETNIHSSWVMDELKGTYAHVLLAELVFIIQF
jgi:hypothetical protein